MCLWFGIVDAVAVPVSVDAVAVPVSGNRERSEINGIYKLIKLDILAVPIC